MSNVWLTSDSHYSHQKNFIWQPRGFNSVEEMNEAIVERWNSVVEDDDIIYHLGDVMMGSDNEINLSLLKRLKGHKYLAYGNHDTNNRVSFFKKHCLFEDIQMGYRIKCKKLSCILTHCPTIVSNGNEVGVLNFYGHTHQQTNFYADAAGIRTYMYHVGVDSHNCYPVNIEDAIAEIKNLGKE